MSATAIILLVIAVSFFILVVFLAWALISVVMVLSSIQKQVDELGHETKGVIHSVNQISDDFLYKMKYTNPFFHAFSNVGEGLEYKSYRFKERAYRECQNEQFKHEAEGDKLLSDLINLALTGVRLWSSYKQKH